MAEDMGLNVVVGLDGSGFTQGIGKVSDQLSYAKAQFLEASSSLGNFGSDMDKLQLKAEYLTAQIDIQQGSVDALQTKYDTAAAATDADGEAIQRLETKLLNAQNVLNNMNNSLDTVRISMEQLETTADGTGVAISADMDEAAASTVGLGTAAGEAGAGFESSLGSIMETLAPMAAMFGLYEGGKEIIKAGVDETNQNAAAQAQLTNQLKTSKDAIGLNITQLDALADSTSKNNDISKASNLTAISTLLNYNAIGKDSLPAATKAVDDLATKIAVSKGQTVPSLAEISQAAKMVGKAMEDPATGTSAFTKALVTFSPSQQAAIKDMQKAGDTAGAQKLLLQDLAAQTSGASTAAASTFQGKVALLKKQMDDFAGGIVTNVESALTSMGETLVNVTLFFENNKVALDILCVALGIIGAVIVMQTGFWVAHGVAVVASNVAEGIGAVVTNALAIAHGVATAAVGVATAAQWLFNAALDANPIAIVILAVAALIAIVILVATHWKEVSGVLLSVWKDIEGAFDTSVKAIGGFFVGLWDGIKTGFSDVVNFLIDGINGLITGFLAPFNLIIKGLDLIPGVNIPQLSLAIPEIPKFDVGTRFLPTDMLIQAHKGEMIVPKSENPYANSGGGTMPTGGNTFYVTIDAHNVKDFNDVVNLVSNLKQTKRAGATA